MEEAGRHRAVDAVARAIITDAGHGDHFGHSTGHGIGLATHEAPSLGKNASEDPLPSPTVFSVEPGVYLPNELGVRSEVNAFVGERSATITPAQYQRELLVLRYWSGLTGPKPMRSGNTGTGPNRALTW